MMWTVVLLLGLVVLAALLYVGYVQVDAWLQVKASPREEMFFCEIHGPIRKKHVITFMGQEVCPTCFHKRLQEAESTRHA